MARTIRDTILDTRAARSRLTARGKPYYRAIEEGLHLGYRKARGRRGRPSVAGKWVARHYVGEQAYTVEVIGVADDFSDADGVAILNFKQAQAKARERMVRRAHVAAGKSGPLTVKQAINSYLEFLESNRKSVTDARYRANAHILPTLGNLEVESLTTDRLRRWLVDMGKSAPRVRTKNGAAQQYRDQPDNEETRRQRKSTSNRTLTVLKAALNRAWRDGKVPSDAAWRRVEAFENVESARIRYLTVSEAKRLINAANSDFRRLAIAGLQTGARYGELCRLIVADFNPDVGTVAVRQSKGGKPRHVVLTEEGAKFFAHLAAARGGNEPLIARDDGSAWRPSQQKRPINHACKSAKIKPTINFHGLRHTYASLSVMNGMPLVVVARNLGHVDTRMVEKHYGHLAPSYVADAVRAAAPRFGMDKSNVRAIA